MIFRQSLRFALLLTASWPLMMIVPAAAQSTSSASIEEVVVTAEKRPEAVRNISGSVSAFTGAQLQQLGAQDLQDYLSRIPGVVFDGQQPGDSNISIRGVSTTTTIAQGQGTVGYFINDVPVSDPSYSIATPDIDTFDVNNVVVSRGPQGTLYGASSLSGAINYEAAKPDTSGFATHVEGTFESADDGGLGGAGKVMVNVPLSDTLAVRGVYVYREDPGYIDNIGTGEKDSNTTLVRGGRIEVQWQPTANTTVNYFYLNQSENTHDLGYDEPGYAGVLKKDSLIPETANFGTEINNLRVDQNLSFATFTATATLHKKTQYTILDDTPLLAGVFPGAAPITISQPAKSSGETFEARLTSPSDQRFEYIVGVYYDDTKEKVFNIGAGDGIIQSIDANYGAGLGELSAPNNVWLDAFIPLEGKEEAAYADVTYHFTDAWKVDLGGRLFHETVHSETRASGFYVLATDGTLTSDEFGRQSAGGFNPKGSITWKPSDDFMSYFLVSKGFRFGGPNVTPSSPGAPVPASFGSDSLINYELGVRSNLFGDRLQLDATAFYIDWSNIQLELQTPAHLNYTTNAGAARNMGLETSANWLLTDDLTFSTDLTYLDAELTQDFNPGGGQPIVPKGSTLPGASKWEIANSLIYKWADAPLSPTFVLSNRYLSRAPGALLYGLPQGGYDLVDARVSVPWGDWNITAFVNNIGDSHGVTSGFAAATVGTDQRFLVQPRTVGLTIDYKM